MYSLILCTIGEQKGSNNSKTVMQLLELEKTNICCRLRFCREYLRVWIVVVASGIKMHEIQGRGNF